MNSDWLFVVSLLVVGYLVISWLFDLFGAYFTPAVPCKVPFFPPRHVDVAEWWVGEEGSGKRGGADRVGRSDALR